MKNTIQLNDVQSRVHIYEECDAVAFKKASGKKTLIFCDIEGAEDELINPEKYPN